MSYRIYGSALSPFVRKACVFLEEKGVDFDMTTIVVGAKPPAEFKEVSPLGKIPAFRDGDRGFSDSSVICAYVERRNPAPALYPADDFEYARALWIEEYADTAVLGAIIPVFFERVIGPARLNKETDEAVVQKALQKKQPRVFDYLESQLVGREYSAGDAFSIADLSVASFFPNLFFAGESLDGERWPNLKRNVEESLKRPSFKKWLDAAEELLKEIRK